ncbi:sigma-70 family RNA polymerase sigma factor [Luteolibacter arcticus]|uniref:Sigma-70 family RNA polymerase sigma factor n=1 Tax=Luteolibacter arcticus TaxID=1581411 RepID=A0ABT3GLN9_9BACT|nr:sigma-70 family RNA polymerase sigma factor [Luteolibacter arcticus]MCW1924395.1 sigma-70 family RNA polymerase sigma factor [Luteolibacter arcticus]
MIDHPCRPLASNVEFEELLIAHQRSLLFYIKSLVSNHHEAEDLLQRTNLILWQKRANFAAGSNFRAWCFTIARLEALNQLRQQRRDQRLFSERSNNEAVPEIFRSAEEEDIAPLLALRDCLERLPSRDKELLFVRYATDRPLKEYAENLSRSPGTLKARLFQLRESLRKSIEARLRESDLTAVGG